MREISFAKESWLEATLLFGFWLLCTWNWPFAQTLSHKE